MFKPTIFVLLTLIQGGASLWILFDIYVSRLFFIMLSCLFLAVLGSPACKVLTTGSIGCDVFFFCHFCIWCLGPGVELDYIDSVSLHSSLL